MWYERDNTKDSRAEVPEDSAEERLKAWMQPVLGRFVFFHGSDLNCGGGGQSEEVRAVMVEESSDPSGEASETCLRGSGTSTPPEVLEMIDRGREGLTPDQAEAMENLVAEYPECFPNAEGNVGRTTLVQHYIDVEGARPVRQGPRRLTPDKAEVAALEIAKMEQAGVIERSCSPWASPVVLVTKGDGSVRFCVDYREVNALTRKDAYPVPHMEDVLQSVGNSKWFCSLDLKSGYWQVPMDLRSKELTAFSIPRSGLWQFNVMPFGLANAVGTFQRLMERVLEGLPSNHCVVYLDDVMVHGITFEETLQHLRAVLERLKRAGLTLAPRKCQLFRREVKFLGHRVSSAGVTADPDKVVSIDSWPELQSRKQVRQFLGLTGFYRRFVPNYARVADPLTRLTQNDVPWRWTESEQTSFAELKRLLVQSPVLRAYRRGYPLILDTDASDTAVGAVLSQEVDGENFVLAYFSKCLSSAERNYCVTRRELLAIVLATRKFHLYCLGQPVRVRTDHASLVWLRRFKTPEGQLARWMEALAVYDLRVEYRPGAHHGNADALSRRPCLDGGCAHCARREDRGTLDGAREFSAPGVSVVRIDAPAIKWAASQAEDVSLARVIEWLRVGVRPPWEEVAHLGSEDQALWVQWPQFDFKDGVLSRKFERQNGEVLLQVVVPSSCRPGVLAACHDDSGHFGVARTQALVLARFYWPGWRKAVDRYVASCSPCQAAKGPMRRPKARLKRFGAGTPFQRIAMDFLGPLPSTSRGNKHILVVSDYFTKWVEAYPLADQRAETVGNVLWQHYFPRFGFPVELHSDQGRNFESEVIRYLCERMSVYKTRTTPYHPQSDGQVERFNRVILSYLRKAVGAERDWDELLPWVLLHYRTAPHAATGFSPASLVYGRELRVPLDVAFPPATEALDLEPGEYRSRLEELMTTAAEVARRTLGQQWERMQRNCPVNGRTVPLQVGDSVRVYCSDLKPGASRKFAAPWKGPCPILEKLTDLLYRVRLPGKRQSSVLHRNRLWKVPVRSSE